MAARPVLEVMTAASVVWRVVSCTLAARPSCPHLRTAGRV
jgi:predicted metal-binding protein